MISVWRIATDAPTYMADELSGLGAKKTGGRWNRPGRPVLYCASSPALACLEILIHLSSGLPFNRFLVEISIPQDVWDGRKGFRAEDLPVGWDALPAGMASLNFGDTWLKSRTSAVMQLPSAISPEDPVILINPTHPDSVRLMSSKTRQWTYDPRLFRG